MSQDSSFAPYGPPENVERIITRVRSNGPPPKFTPAYLTQLGITEGLITRNLQALEFLGMAKDGVPTELTENLQLASDQQWQGILEQALRVAYLDIFQAVDPQTATRNAVDNAFRPKVPKSQRGRQVTLFLGLCQLAGIAPREPVVQRSGQDGPKKTTPAAIRRPRSVAAIRPVVQTAPAQAAFRSLPAAGLHPAIMGIIAALPDVETSDDLDRWVTSFRATFMLVKKIKPDK